MSIAYRRRKKRIREAKKQYKDGIIPRRDFRQMQADWDREVTGPPIGTLQDLIDGRIKL